MSNERLRMVAELQDRASGPMRRIREAAASIRETPGMTQARNWMAGFNKEADKFVKGGGGIAEAMSGMGIGGLAAAASIGTLVARFKELGTHTLALKELGREVGLTTDQVNQFNHAANHFGFDPDRMQGALDHFAGLMPEFRRGYGELNNVLARQPDLIKRLRLEDTKTQLQEIFRFLGTIRNPQDRIKFEEGIFGQSVEPLFAEGTDGFEKQLDRYAKTLQPITKQMEDQARALRDAITDFNDTVGNLETKYGPQILGTLKEGALEVKHTFEDVIKVVETLQRWKDNPRQAINDVSNTATDAVTRGPQYNYDHWHGTGDFRPPTDAADGQTRLDAMQRERDALKAQLDADAKKNPGGFPVRHADDFRRLQDLNGAIAALKDNVVKGAFSKEDPGPSWIEQWRKVHPNSAPGFHPTSFSPEAIEKPITHLVGTLKTAAAAVDENGIKPAAFHPAGLATTGNLDPVAAIAAGTREGFLAAYRELAGISGDDASAARGGFTPAAFHPAASGRAAPGRWSGGGGTTAYSSSGIVSGDGSATTDNAGPGFTAGMRARNLGNIGYFHQKDAGLIGPSNSRDVDHSIALFATQEDGIRAAARLALHKYQSGMRDTAALIAGKGGWTPGALGPGASLNVARAMGLSNHDDLHLDQPEMMHKFLRGLAMQEHGSAGAYYSDAMINRALKSDGSTAPTAEGGSAGRGDAVGIAEGLLGANSVQAAATLRSKMTPGEWCADFVNGVLKGAGGKGMNSSMAAAFSQWGGAVSTDMAKRGDVILERHGNRVGHVGLATGNVRRGPDGHVTDVEMISGNYGHTVRKNWESVGIIAGMRRAADQFQSSADTLRATATEQRDATKASAGSARDQDSKPAWYQPQDRPDLTEERRKAGLTGPQSVKLDGGVRADIHLHDGQVQRASARTHGAVTASSINLRRGPQRTQSV